MDIRSEATIHHPRDIVYRAYRDRLPEIAAYIPDIKEIIEHQREPLETGQRLHNEWVASTEIPKVASKLIRPEQLRWHDHAEWNDEGYYVAWRLQTVVFPDSVRCSGRNTFLSEGDRTRVLLTGKLTIDVAELPGVPAFLGRTLAPQVERFIVSLIKPNLERVNASIEQFLDAEGA